MALPYLPEDELGPMIRQLERDASTSELTNLAQYMKSTWINENKLGAVVVVSIYEINHSNNDVEGWHFRLNRQASGKSQLPSYILVKLLHKEARLT